MKADPDKLSIADTCSRQILRFEFMLNGSEHCRLLDLALSQKPECLRRP